MITQQILHELLVYDNKNLLWKVDRRKNTVKAGTIAGSLQKNGYYAISINGKKMYNHRAIFLMVHGYLPKMIDHINGNKTDNRIENLRIASYGENNTNKRMQSNNTSGTRCVYWHKTSNLWVVLIVKNKKQHCFGYYKKYEDACKVAIEKRKELHGDFFR